MIDFRNSAVIENPYPHLAELRKSNQPIWHPELNVFLAATHRDDEVALAREARGHRRADADDGRDHERRDHERKRREEEVDAFEASAVRPTVDEVAHDHEPATDEGRA